MIYLIWQKSLLTVGKWASTMIDPMKQAQEVKVLRRTQKQNHPLWYSKTVLKQVTSQKNFPKLLGTNWNSKIFWRHKLYRAVGNVLPIPSSLTTCKLFGKSHFDFRDITYDQAFNQAFHLRLERITRNPALAITGAMRDTPIFLLFQEETSELEK